MEHVRSNQELLQEIELLRQQLGEANDTIEAIRNGEIDALVVEGKNGHELYTLNSADRTYRTFIEQMTEGAVTLNAQGIIVYCNTSFAKMVAGPSKDIISHPLADFVAASDKQIFHDLIQRGWAGETKGEIRLSKNQSPIPVQLSITSLKLHDGTALSIIVTDLTSQKEILNQLRENNEDLASINLQLEQSNHDLQQFASVASHDLQEPLRKIQVFSHLLKEKHADEFSATANVYLEKIVHAANRMKVLIIDILNYSRLSSKEHNYVRTDVKAMINELLLDLELTIREKNALITVGNLPELEINPGQMRQVFQNLISNALKFTRKDEAPIIEISSIVNQSASGELCHIHVKDNGIGFDEKFSKSIFNLFEKLHSKDDYDGSGIGLAITKKIVEKHNGFISVSSKVGEGTEFIVSLPVSQLPE